DGATGTPKNSGISLVSPPCALPEKTFSSPKPVAINASPGTDSPFVAGMAGAEGFEPSNTGSKVPRLTAWPRPTVTIPGAFQSWRYGPTGVAELPSANREFIRWAALTATFGGIYRGAHARSPTLLSGHSKGVLYEHCPPITLQRACSDHRGREKDRYFRRVSVSVTTTLARPEIARAAAL